MKEFTSLSNKEICKQVATTAAKFTKCTFKRGQFKDIENNHSLVTFDLCSKESKITMFECEIRIDRYGSGNQDVYSVRVGIIPVFNFELECELETLINIKRKTNIFIVKHEFEKNED